METIKQIPQRSCFVTTQTLKSKWLHLQITNALHFSILDKDIEHFGTGLRRIVSVCQDADVKVEFKQTKIGFTIVFHRFDKAVDKMGRVVTDKMTDKMTDKPTDITDINPREATVIEYLRVNEFITNKKACELLSISTEAVKRLLQSMVQKGLIIAEGENKGRRYKL